jgi:hypothetical protein
MVHVLKVGDKAMLGGQGNAGCLIVSMALIALLMAGFTISD